MSKYQVSLNRINSIDLDVVRANMGEMRLGVSPYMVYDLPNLEMSKDLNILQEAVNKAQKYDQLTEQLGCPVEVYVKLTLNSKIWWLDDDGKLRENSYNYIDDITINEEEKSFAVIDYEYDDDFGGGEIWKTLYLKDYGKTWFLKEDKSE